MTAAHEVRDALGRALVVPTRPRRIVSLVPSLTELLADLGLDEEVVGLTTFCVRPPGWRERKTRVGGTKRVNLERVRALAPDLVLANQEENTQADVEALSALAPVYVTRIADLPEALDAVRGLGVLTARAERGAQLAREIEAAFAALPAPPEPRPRVAYLIWRDPPMVAGGGTFIDAMLRAAGLENAFAHRPRYPETTLPELARLELDALLLSSEPFPFQDTHRAEFARAGCPALLVDGEVFSWYGSRLLHAPAAFQALRAQLEA